MLTDIVSALVRAVSFIALFQAVGIAIFVAIFGRRLATTFVAIRRVGFASALAGLLLVSIHYALEAARMAGALSGVFDPMLQGLVFDSPMSIAWGLRIVGLLLVAAGLRLSGSSSTLLGIVGVMLTAVSFVFVGHTAADADRVWLGVLLTLHVAVVAFWFGALVPLIMVSRKEAPALASQIVAGFTRLASWWVPGIFVAGILMTVTLVDRWAVFGESYGLILLAKMAGFAALMVLAGLNKWRYGPALAATPGVAGAFRRTVAVEYLLICGVLSATAVMTTFFSPEH